MRVNEHELRRLAEQVVAALGKMETVKITGAPVKLIDRIVSIIIETIRQEAAIEEQAEKLAEQHARKMPDLDIRKVIMGIKERLAKEKGFPL